MKGTLVILSGPSGVGKDTVLKAWIRHNPRVKRVVTFTTRAPRPGEANGIDYWFVDKRRFDELASQGAFLEHKRVHEDDYATPVEGTEAALAEGKIAVLKIDVQGAIEVMSKRADAVSIFLDPPSIEELERRIRNRATDDEESIRVRLRNAQSELALGGRYRYRVVNDDVDRAVREIEGIVAKEESRA